ncbi:MAG TPA: DUF3014 domain-containing protein [Steroidobacteraceae bacterium]|jgi:hypothetical protein|nr:DUF3014 domain-containing protein [Steroidobacteraceae bacterium]
MALNSDKPIIWAAAAVVVAGAIALYLYAHRPKVQVTPPASAPEVVASAPAAMPPVASAPVIQHPVTEIGAADSAPLPALNESDKPFEAALTSVPGAQALAKLLVADNLIRDIVVTVDNLSKKKVAVEQRPIKVTSGLFMVLGTGDQLTINPENYARYRPFMEVVKSVDTQKLVQLYFHFYPLFQSAFDDLGYQNAYFNDHAIAQIDHLLATPDVTGPIALVQPNVMYRYADPALEALSPGQKTLIRMGPENEALIKTRLRELKAQLLAQPRQHS